MQIKKQVNKFSWTTGVREDSERKRNFSAPDYLSWIQSYGCNIFG